MEDAAVGLVGLVFAPACVSVCYSLLWCVVCGALYYNSTPSICSRPGPATPPPPHRYCNCRHGNFFVGERVFSAFFYIFFFNISGPHVAMAKVKGGGERELEREREGGWVGVEFSVGSRKVEAVQRAWGWGRPQWGDLGSE